MVKSIALLREELHDYQNPDAKIKRMCQSNELFVVAKGLYETNPNTPGQYLTGIIYGPSYLSFEFALSEYGLIPERVYTYTSATFEKRKAKQYHTIFGNFTYRDVPSKAYPQGLLLKIENGYSYQMATKEKAICDMLYKTSPLHNIKGLKFFLFDHLRIETDAFYALDLEKLANLAALYATQNHKLLSSLIRKETKNG